MARGHTLVDVRPGPDVDRNPPTAAYGVILDRAAIDAWNRANERARTMYELLPTSSRPKCDGCGRISDTAICGPCTRGEPRYTTRPTACGCGAVTWAQTGVCRRCQTGKSDTT